MEHYFGRIFPQQIEKLFVESPITCLLFTRNKIQSGLEIHF